MSELQACVLAAQFKKLQNLWSRREASERYYREHLKGITVESIANYSHKRSPWIYTVRIPGISPGARIELAGKLAQSGIETRPVFFLLSKMPAFSRYANTRNPNAEIISQEGISLPTGSHVPHDLKEKIIGIVKEFSQNAHC